jgi:23S rRNA (cytosine1962-C5)-methyltransferase
MNMFLNRIKKNQAHFRKWAKRIGTQAYRLYDKDIPEYPFAVDVYGEYLVIHYYDEGFQDDEEKLWAATEDLGKVLGVDEEHIFIKLRRRIKDRKNQYEKAATLALTTVVEEQGLKFKVNVSDYTDTGLFLDHRKSRAWVKAQASGKRVLNLFCYTGSVSVAAGVGGALAVDSVDLSQTYLDWAQENFQLNGLLEKEKYRFVREDCHKALIQFKAEGRRYDLIFVDPPSFSNSKRMVGHFDVQEHHAELLMLCKDILSENGLLFFSNNLRKFEIQKELLELHFAIESYSSKTLPDDFRNKKIHNSWLLKLKN